MKKIFLLFLLALAFCAMPAEEACAKKVGAWTVGQRIDEMDDSVMLFAYTKSKNEIRGSSAIALPAMLTIAVQKGSGGPVVCAITQMPWLGIQEDIEVEYRIDKNPPSAIPSWNTNGGDALRFFHFEYFLKELYGAKTLLVRIPSRDGYSYTAKFNITGAKEALKDIAKAAGWQ